ncbi:MAG: TIR domain-containing protein [Chloroflexi bacterium]|nr:TIR domain-containing protein [Chloroflexota bacterium]
MTNADNAQIRVFRKDSQKVVGSGFLLHEQDRIAVTCAHVLASALNTAVSIDAMVGQTVFIDFPFLRSSPLEAQITKIQIQRDDKSGDIALLRILGSLPTGAYAARMAILASYMNHEFSVFGYPDGLQNEGRSVEGRLQRPGVNRQIQAVGTSLFGGFVEEGFSGSPVSIPKMGIVIGMMNRIETPTSSKLAFISTIEEIHEIYRNLDFEDHRGKPQSAGHHVYISFAKEDVVVAQNIAHELQSDDVNVILRKPESETNAQFENDIQLRTAVGIIVLISDNASRSPEVYADWNSALNNYKPIIPVAIEATDIPRMLREFSPIRLNEGFRNGMLVLRKRAASLEDDYPSFLTDLLSAWEKLRAESDSTFRFLDKVTNLREYINTYTSQRPLENSLIDWVGLQERIKVFIEDANVRFPSTTTNPEGGARIVGQRLDDLRIFFRNRTTQQRELANLLADNDSRVISIIGRGGIGKSSLVSKVMGEIERDENEHIKREDVTGILYLSNREQEITSERLYIAGSQMIGGEAERRLRDLWSKPVVPLVDKFTQFIHELRNDLYIVVLDNFEDLLDNESYLRDKELQLFFEAYLKGSHRTKIIITSREPVRLPSSFAQYDRRLLLIEGLPPEDAIKMLRDLDQNGHNGLRDAHQDIQRELVEKVYGVPRALQVVNSILAGSPLMSLRDLLSQEHLFAQDQFIEQLVSENYRRLDADSRHVLNVLAVFGRPVKPEAIAFVLQSFVEGLNIERILMRLISTYTISIDRDDKLVYIHPIDRAYIYGYLKYEYETRVRGNTARALE